MWTVLDDSQAENLNGGGRSRCATPVCCPPAGNYVKADKSAGVFQILGNNNMGSGFSISGVTIS